MIYHPISIFYISIYIFLSPSSTLLYIYTLSLYTFSLSLSIYLYILSPTYLSIYLSIHIYLSSYNLSFYQSMKWINFLWVYWLPRNNMTSLSCERWPRLLARAWNIGSRLILNCFFSSKCRVVFFVLYLEMMGHVSLRWGTALINAQGRAKDLWF